MLCPQWQTVDIWILSKSRAMPLGEMAKAAWELHLRNCNQWCCKAVSGKLVLNQHDNFTQRSDSRGIYFSESVNFFPTYFTALLNSFPISCTCFYCSLFNFFPNFNFGWIFSLPKKQGICKNIFPCLILGNDHFLTSKIGTEAWVQTFQPMFCAVFVGMAHSFE